MRPHPVRESLSAFPAKEKTVQTIDQMSLYNGGLFVARIKFNWFDPNTGELWVSDPGPNITLWFTGKLPPGSVGVPSGSAVIMHVDVVAGLDNNAQQAFLYRSDASQTAKYSISGTTSNNALHFDGIG